jgi:hypothetical protein
VGRGVYSPTGALKVIERFSDVGAVDGDAIARACSLGEIRAILTPRGCREEVIIPVKPNLPMGSQDWLVIAYDVMGFDAPLGESEGISVGRWQLARPSARDAAHRPIPVRMAGLNLAGRKALLAGIRASDLDACVYPIIIDPDFISESGDGYVGGSSATYSTARSTSTEYDTTGTSGWFGQNKSGSTYYVYRMGFKFNTSSLGRRALVTNVTMTLTVNWDPSGASFNRNIVDFDWASCDPISSNQESFYDGALAAPTDALWVSGVVYDNTSYTSAALSTSWVNRVGMTYYALVSARDQSATAPTGYECHTIYTSETSTSSYKPKLTVTYSVLGDRLSLLRAT